MRRRHSIASACCGATARCAGALCTYACRITAARGAYVEGVCVRCVSNTPKGATVCSTQKHYYDKQRSLRQQLTRRRLLRANDLVFAAPLLAAPRLASPTLALLRRRSWLLAFPTATIPVFVAPTQSALTLLALTFRALYYLPASLATAGLRPHSTLHKQQPSSYRAFLPSYSLRFSLPLAMLRRFFSTGCCSYFY